MVNALKSEKKQQARVPNFLVANYMGLKLKELHLYKKIH